MVVRKCKRILNIKKVSLVLLCCLVVVYIGSVIQRSGRTQNREVWSVSGFKNISDGICGAACSMGLVSFYIKTGVENKQGPVICFNDKVIMSDSKKNVYRGINMVVIDDRTLEVVAVETYDTYVDDQKFLKDIMKTVKEKQLVIIASFDEMSESLKSDSRRWIKLLGSEHIDKVTFRDGFILIGQKGLQQGHAIEFLERRGSLLYSNTIEKIGCLSVPLGPVMPVVEALPRLKTDVSVTLGDVKEGCGHKETCASPSFPVMVYTGQESSKLPEICVSNNMVMSKGLNDAGRGINIVIVDPKTGTSKSASRFDTYDQHSSQLEMFLDSLSHWDIVIAVAHDDGSRKLEFHGKELMNQLGSSMIQNLKFRDVWYFIGQKGIDGFTLMENISYSGLDAEWPTPLRKTYCVPSKIIGQKVVPEPAMFRNDKKRDFCKKNDGFGDFCDVQHVDDPPIKPVELVDEGLKKNVVYSSPIIIIAGLDSNALVKTLETIIMQPGVKPENVMVVWDEKFPETADLAHLFNFRNLSIPGSTAYKDQMVKGIEAAVAQYKHAKYLIVLEEEVILAPDFLYFLAQCVPVLEKDPNLLGVTTLNYNGYKGLSGDSSLVYRVEEFPGLGFMVKMPVYLQRMKGRLGTCCADRAWHGWSLPLYNLSHVGHMLVPDMSRTFRQQYEGASQDEKYLTGLFNRPRVTNLDHKATIKGLEMLTEDNYDNEIDNLLKKAAMLDIKLLESCVNATNKLNFSLSAKVTAVYYQQKFLNDYTNLTPLCRCFGLPTMKNFRPKNFYKGMVRLTVHGKQILFIGSKSKFAVHKPSTVNFFIT